MRQLHRLDVIQLVLDDLASLIQRPEIAKNLALQMIYKNYTFAEWVDTMYSADVSRLAEMKDHQLEEWYNERFAYSDTEQVEIISDLDPTPED